jgi:hypothetical protein
MNPLNFTVRFAALLVCVIGCASAPTSKPTASELMPARLYPMAAGSAWSYDVDTGDGSAPVLAISRVIEAGGGRATVQGGEGASHYELRTDGIFGEERGGYLLKAPIRVGAEWPSGGGVQASVHAVGVAISTSAGQFNGCVEVLEQGSSTGAVVTTTYCPDVGPVQVISSLALSVAQKNVRIVARLRGFRVGAEPTAEPQASTSKSQP